MTTSRSVAYLLVAAFRLGAADQVASVEGSVTNSITGEPMARVHVTILSAKKRYGADTNPEGHFSLKPVDPGKYTLTAEAPQFLLDREESVQIGPADSSTGNNLKLIPQAVIMGRVTDRYGDPVENATLEAVRDGKAATGPKTDADGEFRIGGLTAGKYRVHTVIPGNGKPPEIRTDGSEEDYYGETWYPNSRMESGAAVVETRAGVETRGIDIQLARAPIVRVSGTVTGMPKGIDHVYMNRSSGGRGSGFTLYGDKFEFWRLPPGKTRLVAWVDIPNDVTLCSPPVEIDVGDSNIDNVEVAMIPEFDIAGQVDWDASSTPGKLRDHASITLSAAGRDDVRPPNRGPTADGDLDFKGEFSLRKLEPERYQVKISGMPDDAWVKTVRLGPREMPDRILDLTHGSGDGPISVMLSMTGARISGMVVDSKGQPLADRRVTLIGNNERRECRADTGGAYSFRGLAPGTYKLFGGDDDEGADRIDVHESDQISRDLKVP